MTAYGFHIAEEGHVVNILPPIDINGGIVNSDVFEMANHSHVSIIIQAGVIAASSTVTVEEVDTIVPGNVTAIAFDYWGETTALGDTLAAKIRATVAGFAMSTNNNTFYVIEIDANELSADRPRLQLEFSNPGAGAIVSAVAVLSGSRYAKESSETAIL